MAQSNQSGGTPDPKPPKSERRRFIAIIGGALSALGLLSLGVYFLISGENAAPRKAPEIVQVRIVPPPPPPPMPPPPPPPPQPEQKMMEQPPDKPMEAVKEAKTDEPPPGPLSLDAKGDGPPDGFGLGGKPGGRGLVGSGGAGSRWGWYAVIVQRQIETALRSHPRTRDAALQIQVRLWSDGSGRISRVQLVTSTGDSALDAVLRGEILGGLVLQQPPPKDMPMPIVMRITERKSG